MNKGMMLKLLALAAMALILVVALTRIEWKVQERQATRDAAVSSISQQFAGAQQLAGPLLWIECEETHSVTRLDPGQPPKVEASTRSCSRYVRPDALTGHGDLTVSERYRGIYKARVYLASLRLDARFKPADLTLKSNQKVTAAYWVFGVTDPRGIKSVRLRDGDGKLHSAVPGTRGSPFASGFHVAADLESLTRPQRWIADIELAGSGRFDWLPVADDNRFALQSAWPHPSFSGAYLPDTRAISDKGFKANWRINAFAANGDQVLQHASPTVGEGEVAADTSRYGVEPATPGRYAQGFGVSLVDPVDAYVQSDRAIRYGFMFVLLTLGGFYLFELLKRQSLHPLQYLLVGFAVVVFFLLLLALAEHLGFALAYLIAAGACSGLIAAYGRSLIGSWKASAVLGASYGGLFAGLYQLLASEDHALLMGAWLVFGVLTVTMYLTRKLDWQGIGRVPKAPAETSAG